LREAMIFDQINLVLAGFAESDNVFGLGLGATDKSLGVDHRRRCGATVDLVCVA
jgi:hypothetical protein